jgi:hypothetical protein
MVSMTSPLRLALGLRKITSLCVKVTHFTVMPNLKVKGYKNKKYVKVPDANVQERIYQSC